MMSHSKGWLIAMMRLPPLTGLLFAQAIMMSAHKRVPICVD